MTSAELFEQIKKKKSFLCVGLDTDINKIPRYLLDTTDPLFAFNKQIIDATQAVTVAPYARSIAPDYSRYTAGSAMLEVAERLTPQEGEPARRQ